ncbi:MAG TPA: DUF4249 domain-containing protein [Cytophagales bacterium]
MKRSFLSLLPLAAAVLLGACEKEATGIKLPESNSKLVVTGFISPQDTALSVQVLRSTPAFGTRSPAPPFVTNALVTLSDGDQTVTLPLHSKDGVPHYGGQYLIDAETLPVVAGRTYTLRVSVPGGESLEASCTVPEAPAPPALAIDSLNDPDDGRPRYRVRLSWTDPAGQDNYYRPTALVRTVLTENPDQPLPIPLTQPVYWEAEELTDDKAADGVLLYSPRGSFWFGGLSQYKPEQYLRGQLLHVDRHYYLYHRSLDNAYRSEGNPFAEPVLVYSNVTGGLGVFAAYNSAVTEIRLN